MDAIVAPAGAKAKVRMAVSPAPGIRLASVASPGGPKSGRQDRTMRPRRSAPIRPRVHIANREIPTRDLLGTSLAPPRSGPESVASPPGGDALGDPWRPVGRGTDRSMGRAS